MITKFPSQNLNLTPLKNADSIADRATYLSSLQTIYDNFQALSKKRNSPINLLFHSPNWTIAIDNSLSVYYDQGEKTLYVRRPYLGASAPLPQLLPYKEFLETHQ